MNPLRRPTRAVSSTRIDILRGACYFLLAIGLLALGYAGFVFADSHAYQAVEMKKFKQAGRLSEPRILVEGDVIGEIQVPRLRLNAMVVQGDSPANLKRAVGHLTKSALPGEWGNVALAGHRDTFFRPLRDIRLGDEIRFKTRERSFEYRVESIEVVAPTDIRVLKSSTGHDLTLLTCFPIYYVGPAPKRLVVRAREVDGMMQEQLAKGNEVKAPGGPPPFHPSFEAGHLAMKSIPASMAFPEFNRNAARQTGKCAQVNRHMGSRSLALSYLGTSGKRSLGPAQAL